MPRVNIYFTEPTLKELKEYLEREYSGHRALSLVVQKAIKEFLEKERLIALARDSSKKR